MQTSKKGSSVQGRLDFLAAAAGAVPSSFTARPPDVLSQDDAPSEESVDSGSDEAEEKEDALEEAPPSGGSDSSIFSLGGKGTKRSSAPRMLPEDWRIFWSKVCGGVKQALGVSHPTMVHTERDHRHGLACAVVDTDCTKSPFVYVSHSWERRMSWVPADGLGRGFFENLLPTDRTVNFRFNAQAMSRLRLFTAARRDLEPMTAEGVSEAMVLVVVEAHSTEKHLALLHCTKSVYKGRTLLLVVLELFTEAPTMEVLEGINPSTRRIRSVSHLVQGLRERLHAKRTDAEGNPLRMPEILADLQQQVCKWVKKHTTAAIKVNNERAPITDAGRDAVDSFKQKGLVVKMLARERKARKHSAAAAGEQPSSPRNAKNTDESTYENVPWLVVDRAAPDRPLVHVSTAFLHMVGHRGCAGMLGRNFRICQPLEAARNDAVNNDERARIEAFYESGQGKLVSLLLYQNVSSGRHFLAVTTWQASGYEDGRYLTATLELLALPLEMRAGFLAGRPRQLGPLERLRDVLRASEADFSAWPFFDSHEAVSTCFLKWARMVGSEFPTFWEGHHFVPIVGTRALLDFEDTAVWTSMVDAMDTSLRKLHEAQDESMLRLRQHGGGDVACFLADPRWPDCPLVFVSHKFEDTSGFPSRFALGRNFQFLRPKHKGLDERVNGPEVTQVVSFCRDLSSNSVGASMTSLLLNESRSGTRYWNLLRLTHLGAGGNRYVLGVMTVLDVTTPNLLATRAKTEAALEHDASDVHSLLDELQLFMPELRKTLSQRLQKNSNDSMQDLGKDVSARILAWMKATCDDFEGDLLVPKVGVQASLEFQADRVWRQLFPLIACELQATCDLPGKLLDAMAERADGEAGEVVCCCVSDPGVEDCPLVYVTKGFEDLTGFLREHVLGRNCRCLQPKVSGRNDVFNLQERERMRDYCQKPSKNCRLLSLLANETQSGMPFWNLLLLTWVQVKGRDYIFGILHRMGEGSEVLDEMLAAGEEGVSEVRRLREILQRKGEPLCMPVPGGGGSSSLSKLCKEAMAEWTPGLAQTHLLLPRQLLPLARKYLSVPRTGVELTMATPLRETLWAMIEDGVRHFHIVCPSDSDPKYAETQRRLFALKIMDALGVLRARNLHTLSGSLVFSLRTRPSERDYFAEVAGYLKMSGLAVAIWFLDISGLCLERAREAWAEFVEVWRSGTAAATGLYGACLTHLPHLRDIMPPAVLALRASPWNVEGLLRNSMKDLLRDGTAVFSCFGRHQFQMEEELVQSLAHEHNLKPTPLLMKCVEAKDYFALVPCFTVGGPQEVGDRSVLFSIHRSFARQFAAAPDPDKVARWLEQTLMAQGLISSRRRSENRGPSGAGNKEAADGYPSSGVLSPSPSKPSLRLQDLLPSLQATPLVPVPVLVPPAPAAGTAAVGSGGHGKKKHRKDMASTFGSGGAPVGHGENAGCAEGPGQTPRKQRSVRETLPELTPRKLKVGTLTIPVAARMSSQQQQRQKVQQQMQDQQQAAHGEDADSLEDSDGEPHEVRKTQLPIIVPALPRRTGAVAGGESAKRWRSAYEPLQPPAAAQDAEGEQSGPRRSRLVWRPAQTSERPEAMAEERGAITEAVAAQEERIRAIRRHLAARKEADKRLAMRERFDAKLFRMLDAQTLLPM